MQSDPLGSAVNEYFETNCSADILVESNIAEDDVIPSSLFFRTYKTMPVLEKLALSNCEGKILDVGAAAGCHSLYLQNQNFDVSALEMSELCCNVMSHRGMKKVIAHDFFLYSGNKFDTILLLMNGIGIVGTLKRLDEFLAKAKGLLKPSGRIIFDSSDIEYMYYEEDGSKWINLNNKYYGEMIYTMQYKEITGIPFEWLFVDYNTLAPLAMKNGFDLSILATGNHYDYLGVLKKK